MCLIAGLELVANLLPLTQACISIPKFSLPFTVAQAGLFRFSNTALTQEVEPDSKALVSKINNVFGYLESLRTAWAMYDLAAKYHTRTKTTDYSRAQSVILPPSSSSLGHCTTS